MWQTKTVATLIKSKLNDSEAISWGGKCSLDIVFVLGGGFCAWAAVPEGQAGSANLRMKEKKFW